MLAVFSTFAAKFFKTKESSLLFRAEATTPIASPLTALNAAAISLYASSQLASTNFPSFLISGVVSRPGLLTNSNDLFPRMQTFPSLTGLRCQGEIPATMPSLTTRLIPQPLPQ